jgi:DNA-binding NtrC family response regulator
MSSPPSGAVDRPRIVVADEDEAVVAFVIETLREDGNAVFHAYDARSATELALSLDSCHLVISNTRVEGVAGIDLIHQLRERLPTLPILYLANVGRFAPELEAKLPADVPILREPFTADELRTVVRSLLSPVHLGRAGVGPPPARRYADRASRDGTT